MISQDEAKNILDKVMDISTADETEAHVSSHRSVLTRFADNHIHQNVSEEGVSLSVTAILGKKMGSARTSKLDDESIRKTVSNAIEIARFAPPDDELLPRLGPQKYREVQSYDTAVDRITPMERARSVAGAVHLCEENGLTAAGVFSDGSGSSAMANSSGLYAFHKSSGMEFSVTSLGKDSSGWATASSHRKSAVDPESVSKTAVEKSLMSREPRDVPPGSYTVVLEPAAVAGLLVFMSGGFNALAMDEGRSFLTGRMGQEIAGDNITMISDPYHPLHQGRPFDGDGVPTKPVALIEKGIATNLVYDRLTAKKHGVEPTGHGGGGRNSYGAYPSYLAIKGGNSTLEEMIASTDRGILVTKFHYMNVVDPMKVIVTGMTRDGTFWIEKGKIAYGIKNFRFNQNVLEALKNVEMMSKPISVGRMVVPAMKVRKFSFTSGTDAV